MFDTRGVSRERIIGISFADILIQTVFLLLLILIVGYVDPIERLKIKEYEDKRNELLIIDPKLRKIRNCNPMSSYYRNLWHSNIRMKEKGNLL